MPRRVGRFLGRAGTARRLLPLSAVAPLLFRCAHARRSRGPLRCAAGRAAALGCVGAGRALSADFVGIEGRPGAAQRLQFRVLARVFLESGAKATRRGGHPPAKAAPTAARLSRPLLPAARTGKVFGGPRGAGEKESLRVPPKAVLRRLRRRSLPRG
jgi:hypothetical protein